MRDTAGTTSKPFCGVREWGAVEQIAHAAHGEHLVQLYETDEFLVEAATAFIGAGLSCGDGLVLILTRSHQKAFAGRLLGNGYDMTALAAGGHFVALDAEEVIDQILVGGAVDSVRFQQLIGEAAARARTSRGLRMFEETVVALLSAGKTKAAARMEQEWNALRTQHPLTLMSAYPIAALQSAAAADHLTQRRERSRLLPSEAYWSKMSDLDRLGLVAELQQKAIALDVEMTRRRRAEEDARNQQSHLRAIVENTPECIKVMRRDGTLLNMNASGLRMVEADAAEEVLGNCVFDLIAPEHRQEFRSLHLRVCEGHREQLEYEIIGLKGTRRWVETNAVPIVDPATGERMHLAVTRDISERKKGDEARRHMAAIVESSDDAIISKDLNGIITSWNQGAERLFGYTATEVIGHPIYILIPEDRVNEEPGILDRIRKGQRIEHYETVRRRKNGTLVDVSLTVSPIKNDRGKVIGASKIARDITDRVRAKEKLEQIVAERTALLRDMVSELEAFSYSVAHDMRAPLRSMTSYARFLEEDFAADLPDEAREFVRRISTGAQRLDALITDVLNYSKVSRGEMTKEKIDLEKLAREIIDSYPEFQPPRAEIILATPLPSVHGNMAALTQSLSNLLSNAVKFVPRNTTPHVVIRAEKRGEWVRLWVEDNGIGISEEGQKRIFKMFQRLNPARDFEGTGIGLTIVRKAIERMGGRVGVQSQPGSGSRFWIELKEAS